MGKITRTGLPNCSAEAFSSPAISLYHPSLLPPRGLSPPNAAKPLCALSSGGRGLALGHRKFPKGLYQKKSALKPPPFPPSGVSALPLYQVYLFICKAQEAGLRLCKTYIQADTDDANCCTVLVEMFSTGCILFCCWCSTADLLRSVPSSRGWHIPLWPSTYPDSPG